jgi:predicted RND superfamily exporter protein
MSDTFFQRYSRHVLIVCACLVPLIGWGAYRAHDVRDNSVLGWLPEGSPVTIAYRKFLRIFGPDEAVLASWKGCELDDPAVEKLAEAIEAHRAAAAAGEGPSWFASVSTGTRLRDQVAEAGAIDAAEATKRLAGVLVGPDGKTTCVLATLEALDDDGRRAVIQWMAEQASRVAGIPAGDVRLTGDAVIGVAIDTENERTASTWSNLAVVVALVIAVLSIGSLRVGMMVLAVGGFASIASEAVVYMSGAPMNMLVALVPVVTFVLGVSAAVHLAAYWREALIEHGPALAPTIAVRVGWLPSFISALTTVLGLGSLCVSQVRPVWHFGLFGAIGTAVAFAIVFLMLPALLQVFPGRPSEGGEGEWPWLVRWTRGLLPWHRQITFTSLALFALVGTGLWHLRTEVRPARFLPQQSRWIQDLEWFNTNIGPFQTIDVVLCFDGDTPSLADRAALVQEVQVRLREGEDIRGNLSAATFLPDDLLGFGDRGAARSVMRRGVIDGRLRRALPQLMESGMVGLDGDRQLWRITLQSFELTPEKQDRLREEVDRTVAAAAEDLEVAAPSEAVCTGGVPLVLAAQRELLNAFLESFVLAFVTIVAVLALFLRSPAAGLLAMLPNIFPVVIVFGVLGWMGRRLDVGGMMTASVALGIAVDDTVHLLTWFHRFRGMPGTAIDRVAATLRRAAVPIARTSLILAPSFGIFTFCGFQPIAQFGMLLCLLLTMAVIADLVMLPALLAGPIGGWFEGPSSARAPTTHAEP